MAHSLDVSPVLQVVFCAQAMHVTTRYPKHSATREIVSDSPGSVSFADEPQANGGQRRGETSIAVRPTPRGSVSARGRELLRILARSGEPGPGWHVAGRLADHAEEMGAGLRSVKRWLAELERTRLVQRRPGGRKGLLVRLSPRAWAIAQSTDIDPLGWDQQRDVKPANVGMDERTARAFAAALAKRELDVMAGRKRPLRSLPDYRATVLAAWRENPQQLEEWVKIANEQADKPPVDEARLKRALAAARRKKEFKVERGKHRPIEDWPAWLRAVDLGMRADPSKIDAALVDEEKARVRAERDRKRAEAQATAQRQAGAEEAEAKRLRAWYRIGMPAAARARVDSSLGPLPRPKTIAALKREVLMVDAVKKICPPPPGWEEGSNLSADRASLSSTKEA